jgi:hypothetical protein
VLSDGGIDTKVSGTRNSRFHVHGDGTYRHRTSAAASVLALTVAVGGRAGGASAANAIVIRYMRMI